MKKVLFLLPVAALALTTGCDMNKSSEKKLNCSIDSFGETNMTLTFVDDKIKDIDSTTVFVLDSEEEANNIEEQLEDIGMTGYVVEKIEGTKVTLKMSEEELNESKKSFEGMSYDAVKAAMEEMGAVCK